jgi:hypothetical protein
MEWAFSNVFELEEVVMLAFMADSIFSFSAPAFVAATCHLIRVLIIPRATATS